MDDKRVRGISSRGLAQGLLLSVLSGFPIGSRAGLGITLVEVASTPLAAFFFLTHFASLYM